MSIQTAAPVALPAILTQNVAYSLSLAASFPITGVTASAVLRLQKYVANPDGTSPVVVGAPVTLNVPDVFKAAAADPATAALVGTVSAAMAAYVAAKGL